MAVIRAKRLWLNLYPAGGGGFPLADPHDAPSPEALQEWLLYSCPAGKRAIVRHADFIIYGSGGVADPPQVAMYVEPADAPGFKPAVFWAWFRLQSGEHYTWSYRTVFDGQLVLHAGDKLTIGHNSVTPLGTQGSGHELNELV